MYVCIYGYYFQAQLIEQHEIPKLVWWLDFEGDQFLHIKRKGQQIVQRKKLPLLNKFN